MSVTDSASAAQYGLQTASLSPAGDDTADRTFVAPDPGQPAGRRAGHGADRRPGRAAVRSFVDRGRRLPADHAHLCRHHPEDPRQDVPEELLGVPAATRPDPDRSAASSPGSSRPDSCPSRPRSQPRRWPRRPPSPSRQRPTRPRRRRPPRSPPPDSTSPGSSVPGSSGTDGSLSYGPGGSDYGSGPGAKASKLKSSSSSPSAAIGPSALERHPDPGVRRRAPALDAAVPALRRSRCRPGGGVDEPDPPPEAGRRPRGHRLRRRSGVPRSGFDVIRVPVSRAALPRRRHSGAGGRRLSAPDGHPGGRRHRERGGHHRRPGSHGQRRAPSRWPVHAVHRGAAGQRLLLGRHRPPRLPRLQLPGAEGHRSRRRSDSSTSPRRDTDWTAPAATTGRSTPPSAPARSSASPTTSSGVRWSARRGLPHADPGRREQPRGVGSRHRLRQQPRRPHQLLEHPGHLHRQRPVPGVHLAGGSRWVGRFGLVADGIGSGGDGPRRAQAGCLDTGAGHRPAVPGPPVVSPTAATADVRWRQGPRRRRPSAAPLRTVPVAHRRSAI